MHDLGRVQGEGPAALGVLVCDQSKHAMQLCQGRLAGVHQRVAAADCRPFCDPAAVELAVHDDLVVGKGHASSYSRYRGVMADGRPPSYSPGSANTTSRSFPRGSPLAGAETLAATYCRPSLPA